MPKAEPFVPVATRMRPRTVDEYVGQEHLLSDGKLLNRAIRSKMIGFSTVLQAVAKQLSHW